MRYKFSKRQFASNRDSLLLDLCKNKKVLHIGATDAPFTEEKFNKKILLHQKLCSISADVLGIDIDLDAVNFLKNKGINNIIIHDMNDLQDIDYNPEVIIFGETIEHIQNIGTALTKLKQVMGNSAILAISTPNALYINNYVCAIVNKEVLHDDHKVNFTYGTLSNMLVVNDFDLVSSHFTFLNRDKVYFKQKLYKIACKFFPAFSETLLFVVKKAN
jgi:2-polyprenyl-3-methyl-5-hydroxy-6-metoxy-1,4-benzoquinol methylase